LRDKKIPGVHIVTSPGDRSVEFYKKNKFDFCVERHFNGKPILFMGLTL